MKTQTRCWPENATQKAINLITAKYGQDGLRGFLNHVEDDGRSGSEWLAEDPGGLLAKLRCQPKTPLEEAAELVEHLRSLEGGHHDDY